MARGKADSALGLFVSQDSVPGVPAVGPSAPPPRAAFSRAPGF